MMAVDGMLIVISPLKIIMETSQELVAVANEIIRINNDRQDGYQLAARETKDEDLKKLFAKFASDSATFRDQLMAEVSQYGGEPAKDSTVQGKVYRAWMEIKKAVTGGDRHAILASCEFGEDAALEAYDNALKSDALTSEVREMLHRQRLAIREAHDVVKQLRDSSKK